MLSQSPEILHLQQAYSVVTEQVLCPENMAFRGAVRHSLIYLFLHKEKEEDDSCWGISHVWDGGTYLPHWPETFVGLLPTRCSDLGWCWKSAEACLSFWLSPPAAYPPEHQWYWQGMLSVPRLATRFGTRMEGAWIVTGFWDKNGACFWLVCVS